MGRRENTKLFVTLKECPSIILDSSGGTEFAKCSMKDYHCDVGGCPRYSETQKAIEFIVGAFINRKCVFFPLLFAIFLWVSPILISRMEYLIIKIWNLVVVLSGG